MQVPLALDALRHKLRYLEAKCQAPVERGLAAAAFGALPEVVLSPSFAALTLDVVYAVVRNAHWLATPLFQEALGESLAAGHGLDRRRAAALAEAVILRAEATLPLRASHVGTNDDELLRYVFVTSLAAEDEDALLLDLGYGAGLLRRIRSAFALEAEEGNLLPDGTRPFRFVPEIDARISHAMSELAAELAAAPYALDVHRLRYLLVDIGDPWREALTARGAGWLFGILAAMGRKRVITVRQVRDELTRTLADEMGVDWSALAADLLAALHRHELAVLASGHGDGARWELLPRAQELTAAAVTAGLLEECLAGGEDPMTELASLCPAYQAQLVRDTPSLGIASLVQLASGTRPLSPQALDAVLARLATVSSAEHALQLAQKIATEDPSQWLRRAAESAAGRLATRVTISALKIAPLGHSVPRFSGLDADDGLQDDL